MSRNRGGAMSDDDERAVEDVLAAFNAEEVVTDPGRPEDARPNPVDPDDNASDADAPAP